MTFFPSRDFAELPFLKHFLILFLGLEHLCEFIEDCEYPILATKILHLIGSEGPQTSSPSKYIRYIYNRIVLENENVRASAVSALAKFGLRHEELRPKIVTLLKR